MSYQNMYYSSTGPLSISRIGNVFPMSGCYCIVCVWTTTTTTMIVPRGHACVRVSNNRWPHRVSFVSQFVCFLPAGTPTTSTFQVSGVHYTRHTGCMWKMISCAIFAWIVFEFSAVTPYTVVYVYKH